MKQTVLSLGPSMAGFSRRPVFIPGDLGGTDLVAVMSIAKHICFNNARGFLFQNIFFFPVPK
jgi:hypothetical protein